MVGIPGVTFSGLLTYGIAFVIGASHAAKVAAATLKPKNFRKSLLAVDVSFKLSSAKKSSTDTSDENSCSLDLRNAGVSFNSSIPFQYFLVIPILL